MSVRPGRLLRDAALLVPVAGIALLLAAACGRDITGTGTGTRMRAMLVIPRPAFQATSSGGGDNDVVALRITISATDGVPTTTSVSRVIADVVPNIDSLDNANSSTGGDQTDTVGVLAVSFPIQPGNVTYSLVLKAVDATGDTTYAGGPTTFSSSDISLAGAVKIDVRPVYVGPGANATRVVASPRSAALVAFGSSNQFQFSAQAFDASGAAIPRAAFQWQSLDTTIVDVDGNTGLVHALNKRGTAQVMVEALGPNHASDIVSVSVTLPAQSLLLVSGAGQSATAGTALAAPIVYKAVAQDGVPVPGTIVNFSAQSGGSVNPSSATADANGRVQTTWTLGSFVGSQTLNASIPNGPNTALQATATGTSSRP